MTNLSPAAQAVLDAAADVYWDWADMSPASSSIIAATALRAAADQVVPDTEYESYEVLMIAMSVRHKLLAIAAELEAQ